MSNRPAAALLILLLAAGCAGEGDGRAGSTAAVTRCEEPRVCELRRALDLRQRARARALRADLGSELAALCGVEAHLLDARLFAMDGLDVEAQQYLEAARARAEDDPRVLATAVELHAAAGREETAASELARLDALFPAAAETKRAAGVFAICRSGGAAHGLALLEDARRADPALPFCERPLSQAHLLVGKAAQAREDLPAALHHGQRALAFDAEEPEAKRFLAEALAAGGDLEGALTLLRDLRARGEDSGAECARMEKRAGMLALLQKDRPRAIEHFLAARAAGLAEEELASGAAILAEEARRAWEEGLAAYESDRADDARVAFARAVELDPERLDARHLLALLLFADGAYERAAEQWRELLTRAGPLELPDPVHEFLAHALWRSGERAAARAELERYLREHPQGAFVATTRTLLAEYGTF